MSLEVVALPEFEQDGTRYYCLNNFPTPIILVGGVVNDTPNNYYYLWSTGEDTYQFALDDINGVYQSSNRFENVSAGIHTVYVKDIKNDCGIVSADVSVIGFPKYFTPNGDAYNQTWKIRVVSEQFQPNTKIKIYNRYGNIVAKLDPLGAGWDGTSNGALLPSDDYWFSVELQDGRVFTGHFTLKL